MFVNKYTINVGFNLKAAYVSDVHKYKDITDIIETVKKIQPDIIFFGGDMVSRTTTDMTNYEILCKELTKMATVYAVEGNHEQSLPEDKYAEYMCISYKYNINTLINETVEIKKGVYLSGINYDYHCYKNKNKTYFNLKKYYIEDILAALGEAEKGFNILLAHNPMFFKIYAEWGADLTLSGHVHGGIVRVADKIGLLSPERKMFPKYTKGEYFSDGFAGENLKNCNNPKRKMIVSAGIGKFRLFNPPEILEIDFRKV